MINISGAPPNSLKGGPPPPPYYDNYSGPANPACFLTFNASQYWGGQSFTTTQKYNLATVELWIKKGPGANVGDVNIELYAVDGNGHPDGPVLNSGVIPNADISEDYAWVSCDLDDMRLTAYQLNAATKYCVVVNGLGFTDVHLLEWACGGSDNPNNPSGEWITPTGNDEVWNYPELARDDSIETWAWEGTGKQSWTAFITLSHAALLCSKIRFMPKDTAWKFTLVDVDVYYDGGWHNVYQGGFSRDVWNEKDLGGCYQVTEMRLRFYNDGNAIYNMLLIEVDFWQDEGCG